MVKKRVSAYPLVNEHYYFLLKCGLTEEAKKILALNDHEQARLESDLRREQIKDGLYNTGLFTKPN